MRPSKVLQKLRNNQPVLCHALHTNDPQFFEMLSLMGCNCFWLDQEHHFRSQETIGNLCRAARVGTTELMIRPGKGEFMQMMRHFEMGAHGVMYPRCDNAAEAREVVKWAKFAPMGKRGFDGGNPDMPYCAMDVAQYVQFANDNTFVVIQVEEQSAVDQVDEIAAVEGVDVVFLGPADFTVLSGIPGEFRHAKVDAAIEKVAAAAKRHGKAWGMPVGDASRAKELMDMGATFLANGADLIAIKSFFEKIHQDFTELGFSFDNQLVSGASYMEKA